MKPIEYLLHQFELEGIRRVSGDLIARISPDPDDFPLVLVARTVDGQTIVCFDELLPADLCNQLPKNDLRSFKTEGAIIVLEESGISAKADHFKTYIFPDGYEFENTDNVKCLGQDDPKIEAFGFHGLTHRVFAVEQDGIVLSACASSRQNSTSAEAWVFTHPAHRRKGLAQQVAAAWAGNLQREGITPFYSHNVENIDSAFLAKRLKLIHVFDETVIEKVS